MFVGMTTQNDVERLVSQAESDRCCVHGVAVPNRRALQRRAKRGEFVRPYPGLYARAEYWQALNPQERTAHVIYTLSRLHPRWVFHGLSAVTVLGLEHQWSLHQGEAICIAAKDAAGLGRNAPSLRRVYVSALAVVEVLPGSDGGIRVRPVDGGESRAAGDGRSSAIRIVLPAQALVECALRYPFEQVLPMIDSALRMWLVTVDDIVAVCDRMHIDCGPVLRLLYYADPLSENGGESLCRGVIVDSGFARPELQHVFTDPETGLRYRVDFVWHTSDGRVIVLEYDGTRKYVDPSMTGRRGIQDVVRAEREREDALRRAGVTCVIRVTYDEVVQRAPLLHKLMEANVPYAGMHPLYERRADGSWG